MNKLDDQSKDNQLQAQSILDNKQLLEILELNAEQMVYFLEDEILANPFIELKYPLEIRTTIDDRYQHHHLYVEGAIPGVDPQLPQLPQSLPVFLYEQIILYRRTPIRDAMVRLVDRIDERGYLPYTAKEAADFLDIPEIVALDAITLLQQLEPAGVAAYNLRECLMLQTERDNFAPEVAYYLLESHYQAINQKDYQTVMEETGLSLEEIEGCVNYYQTLQVRPAALFAREESINLVPDMTVVYTKGDTDIQLRYNSQYYPNIEFNQAYYEEVLQEETEDLGGYCQDHRRHYEQLAQNLKWRKELLFDLAQIIVKANQKFFTHQSEDKTPLLFKDLVEEIQLPETVLHLLIRNKNIEFEKIVSPLAAFINTASIAGKDGLSAVNIKAVLESVLRANPGISDDDLCHKLEDHRIIISEQVVQMYRKTLNL